MASYTSRIILVLAIPSIFGIISILFYKKRKSISLKNIDTEVKSSFSLNTLHKYQQSMKLKHQSCVEDSVDMHLKEDHTAPESNKNGSFSYANCLKQIQSREVLITADGVEDVISSEFSEMQISTSNGSKIMTGENLKGIKKTESTSGKSIAEFSYYGTGARPKVKTCNALNASSRRNHTKSVPNGNIETQCSSSQNYLKFNGKSENILKQVNGKKKIKTGTSVNGLTSNISSSENISLNESVFNGVSDFKIKSKKKNKGKLHGNNNSCTQIINGNKRDNSSKDDSIDSIHTLTVSNEDSTQEQVDAISRSENMDKHEAPVVQTETRTLCTETCNGADLTANSLIVNESFLDGPCKIDNFDDQYNSDGPQCLTPESGISSSNEKSNLLQIDVNSNQIFDDTTPNCHEPIVNQSESTYCDSVNFESLQLESYEVLFDGFLLYFQVPRFCASFLKNVPCVSKWSCPYFQEAEDSNDSGKGGSEIVFGVENQSTSMIYEFDFPVAHCGVLIGKKGSFVHYIKEKSNATIVIRNFPFNNKKKLVTLYGEEDEINLALEIIRDKFPLKKYEDITLEPTSCQVVCPLSLKLSLPEGVEFQVVLSATINAGHFFVQLPTHPSYHALPPFTMSMTSMYTHCDTPQITDPCVGNIVAAPVGVGWFRAEVVDIYENETCKLKYLDYGGYQVVPRSLLRKINIEYMQMPFQAIECYLSNVTCYEEFGWTLEAKAHFESLAQGQILSAYVAAIADDGVPCLYLYQVNGATNTFINQALVEAGHLKWVSYENEEPET